MCNSDPSKGQEAWSQARLPARQQQWSDIKKAQLDKVAPRAKVTLSA